MDFQVSLRDADDVLQISANNDGDEVTILDQSNYATNTEAQHEQAKFSDYRVLSLEQPSGDTVEASSIGSPDVSIDSGDTNGSIVIPIDEGDGVYIATLTSIPTFAAGNYETNDIVYHSGTLYKALANNSGVTAPNLDAVNWVAITIDDVTSKYQVEEKFVVASLLNSIYYDNMRKAVSEINTKYIDMVDETKNKYLLKAMKAFVLRDSVTDAVNKNNFEEAANILSIGEQLEDC